MREELRRVGAGQISSRPPLSPRLRGESRREGFPQSLLHAGGWREEELAPMRKGDKVKVKLAQRLRGETTMSLKWIAERLQDGQLDLRFQPVA